MNVPIMENAPVSNASALQKRSGEILGKTAAFRSEVYRWLALGFYPPEEDLLQGARSGQMANELRQATLWLGPDQASLVPAIQRLDEFKALTRYECGEAYSRLFEKGLERISLREHSYRWQDAAGLANNAEACTNILSRIYASCGTKSVPGLEDHAAVELEFLAYLCSQEAGSWQALQFSVARTTRRLANTFLLEHLGRWLPEICWRIQRQNSNRCGTARFYTTLADLSVNWLTLEMGSGRLAG